MRVQNIHVLGVESQAFPAQVPAVFPDHSFPSRGGSPFFLHDPSWNCHGNTEGGDFSCNADSVVIHYN